MGGRKADVNPARLDQLPHGSSLPLLSPLFYKRRRVLPRGSERSLSPIGLMASSRDPMDLSVLSARWTPRGWGHSERVYRSLISLQILAAIICEWRWGPFRVFRPAGSAFDPAFRTRFRGLPASLRRFRDRLVTELGRGRVATGRVA